MIGQSRISTPYMTVYLVISLPKYRTHCIYRVGQNCISAPYMTVCMVISLLKLPYVLCTPYIPINVWFWPTLCIYMVLANPTYIYGSGPPYVYIWFWPTLRIGPHNHRPFLSFHSSRCITVCVVYCFLRALLSDKPLFKYPVSHLNLARTCQMSLCFLILGKLTCCPTLAFRA
jgi:hypothetical protein